MKKLRIFRMEDGERLPYVIELDAQMTVTAEYLDPAVKAPAAPTSITRGGRSSEGARIVAAWTTDSIQDNPIPGTDDLRAEFFEAKRALYSRHEAAGTKCPGCELGQLLRQYRDKLEEGGHLTQFQG